MKQHRLTTRRHLLNASEMQGLLEEILLIGDGKAPTRVVGWTRNGIFTRLQADYPNGFGLTVHFDKTGNVSSAKASMPTIKLARK